MNRIVLEQELASLEKDGRLTPADVVAAAENPNSALHTCFEWNDQVAAHEHRLATARSLIREVKVRFVIEEKIVRSVCYVRDPESDPHEQGYVRLARIQSKTEAAAITMLNEMTRLEGTLTRALSIAEVLGLTVEVEEVMQKAATLRTLVEIERAGVRDTAPTPA